MRINKFLIRSLIKVSGNRFVQQILQRNIMTSQYLMGIGSGSDVSTSGERIIFDVLSRNIPPILYFDDGSHKGHFLNLILESISMDDLSIHCFEPGGAAFKSLKRNFEKDNKVRLNNIALGKNKSETVLYYNEPGSELSSLTKRKLDHFGINFNQYESIQIDTIDNYCLANSIERIHLLKIDVEGHELDVLSGAKRMFNKKAIDIVTFEFGGCNIDTRTFFRDFWDFFSDKKMKVYRITPSGYCFLTKSYKEMDEQFLTTNFMCI